MNNRDKNFGTYTVALIQMRCEYLQLEQNLEKASRYIREAAAQGAKLICLPEAFNTGYYGGKMELMMDMAEEQEGYTFSRMSALAKELQIFIMAPYFIKNEKGTQNSAVLIDDEGQIVGTYAKSHPIGEENRLVTRGNQYPVWQTKLGNIGCLICYDVCFPETARLLAVEGADVILVPAAWRASHYFIEWWNLNIACRALDNLVYVAAVNQIGKCGEEHFAGMTKICGPVGDVIATAGVDDETIIYGEVSHDRLVEERAFNTVMSDRKIEDYAGILK